MLIGVVSDTHVLSFADLDGRIVEALKEVDLVVHAGDFISPEVLEGLKRINHVRAVQGNMDLPLLKAMLPEKDVFEVEGRKVGLIHGWGAPQGIEERIRKMFGEVDIIIYGHSHESSCGEKEGVFFFNPGLGKASYGLLTVGERIEGRIIKLP
jgi:hypothetical protein